MAIIRQIEVDDFNEISSLYDGKKSLEYLKWLFKDDVSSNYNGFVAIDEKKQIIGVIGYQKNIFYYDNNEIEGIICFSWKVADSHSGFAAIQLLSKVYSMCSFGYALNGTKIAQKIFQTSKLEHVKNAEILIKILNPVKYFKTSVKPYSKRLFKLFYYSKSLLNTNSLKNKNLFLSFELYNNNYKNVIENNLQIKSLRLKETNAKIQWKLKCPVVKSYCFIISKESLHIGIIILYVHDLTKSGVIVHISDLGNNMHLWEEAIKFIIGFFKNQKCAYISALGNNINYLNALKKFNFIKYPRHYPIFVKETAGLDQNVIKTWHLTGLETDRGSIRFEY